MVILDTEQLISISKLRFKEIINEDNISFQEINTKHKDILNFVLLFDQTDKKLYDLYVINTVENKISIAFIHYGKHPSLFKFISKLNKKNYNIEMYLIENYNIIRKKYNLLNCFLITSDIITDIDILNIHFNYLRNVLLMKFCFFLEETKNNRLYVKQRKSIKYILKKGSIYKNIYILIHDTDVLYNLYKYEKYDYFILFKKYITFMKPNN